MKMRIVSVSLVFCFSLFAIMLGCGQQTTTTTTVTIASAQVDAAKTGVLLASGGASVGTSATGVGSAANVTLMSVKATQSGPPDSFFVSLLTGTASIDGYLSPTSESVGGNMTPYMRLKTKGGSLVNGAFLSNKKIAKMITVEVQAMMSAGEHQMPQGITAEVENYVSRYVTAYKNSGVHPFNDQTIFRAVSTEADYMAWMFMYPGSMESGMSSMAQQYNPGAPSHVYTTTPEASTNDKIGAMEMKMVFSKSATGEIVLSVNTEPGGKPVTGTYSGTGTLTTPAGSMETTLSMGFSTDGPPTSVTLTGTTESTPAYTVKVYMCPMTMTATGEIFSGGTRIGTLEGSPAGGRVYIGTSTEAFSF